MIHQVDFEKGVPGKQKGVFVIFHSKGKPWKDYRTEDSRKQMQVDQCLLIFRADGSLGAVGGKAEEGEGLPDAAKREIAEEIGHKLELELKPVVAHDIGQITSHAFSCQISYEMLRHIQTDASEAEDFGSAIVGAITPHLVDYEKKDIKPRGGIVNLVKCSMAPSLREELMHFLLNEKIFSQSELDDICLRAGYKLSELLK